jgi:excisionase family DNA binding protein
MRKTNYEGMLENAKSAQHKIESLLENAKIAQQKIEELIKVLESQFAGRRDDKWTDDLAVRCDQLVNEREGLRAELKRAKAVELYDVSEAGRAMHLEQSTIRAWISERRIPFVRMGRRVFFRKVDIDKYITDNIVHPRITERKKRRNSSD